MRCTEKSMWQNKIRIILFDLGGVLVELTGVPTMIKWTGNNHNNEQIWEMWLKSPAVRSFEIGLSTAEEFAAKIIDEMNLPVQRDEFIDAFSRWPKGLYPGVPQLLNKLGKQYILACLSNSNTLHWPKLMREMGLEKMFNHIFASHLTGKLKPDKASFEHVLDSLACKAESVLFLDDNEINVNGARNCGINAHKVTSPQNTEALLEKLGIL